MKMLERVVMMMMMMMMMRFRKFENLYGVYLQKCDVADSRITDNGDDAAYLSKRFVCTICGASLSSQRNLNQHLQRHAGRYPYQCKLCGKGFSSTANLRGHMPEHTGVYEYKCSLCDMEFKYRYQLTRHAIIHVMDELGRRRYKCMLCGSLYSSRSNLFAHQRLHAGRYPYYCPVCQKGCGSTTYLRSHLSSTHGMSVEFKCECGREFDNMKMLKEHAQVFGHAHPYDGWQKKVK
ncbi:hypothetical protein LSH36_63g05057 [Paralvinella palmiformis]|uniref:C2H2-type domain-containing protein n=1 Tax=Paralvinella palmiformis TaxID=53620 RepID=A0AAD9K4Y4_9ANNE|nr:hypothetical protein LSH36_63g05057 [Paralvinella palmiformis]